MIKQYSGEHNQTVTSFYELGLIINEPTYIRSNSSPCTDLNV